MATVIKTEWFGKQVSVLMVNGKTVRGELAEVTENYLVLNVGAVQMQIMVHAIIAIRLATGREPQEQ
jgi:sRNA-binding regulator protein Hfq